jgi:hypothetical protein
VAGNTITWEFPDIPITAPQSIQVTTQVPADIGLLGTVLLSTASVSTVNTDGNSTNNSATVFRTITAAYDPNDKLATTSSGNTMVWLINEDEWIDYTIRFQNTGTDTAFTVIVTDTLPPTLDPGSIIWGAASHAHSRLIEGQGTMKFIFPNILLPDSNVNEPLSHGFVGFRIRPRLPVLPGTTIENIANIYFDFNPPIITEPSVLTAEFSTGVGDMAPPRIVLVPNPATDQLQLADPARAAGTWSWSILTIDGRTVRSEQGPFPAEGISIAPLRNGTYALQLHLSDRVITERFIKAAYE